MRYLYFMEQKYNKNLLVALLCLAFTIFAMGTGDLFFANKSEFWFHYSDMVPSFLVMAGVLVIVLFFINSIWSEMLQGGIVATIFALNCSFYIQGNFLPNNYGTLNGEAIDWSKYSLLGAIGIIVWIAIFAIHLVSYLKKRKYAIKYMTYIGAFIFFTQAFSLATIGMMSKDLNAKSDYYFTSEGEFEISNNSNTIIILLDCFDAAVMNEAIKEYPDTINQLFEDFTFYKNTVGGATRTKYAIPYIFCGETNKKEQSYLDYLKDSSAKSRLFSELNNHEYDARVYSNATFFDVNQKKVLANMYTGDIDITSKWDLSYQYLQLVLFRHVPQFLKQYFWMYSGDFDRYKQTTGKKGAYSQNDIRFYQELCEQKLVANNNKKCFRFYHLNGAHPPYVMSTDVKYVGENETNELRQAIGSLKIAGEYIKQMKTLGVYDNATIVVMADHGAERGVEQNPLLLVKAAKDRHQFAVSSVKLSYKNINEYLAKSLKERETKISEYETKDTRYFYVEHEDNSVVNIIEWASDGDAWDFGSFYKTGNTYHGDSLVAKSNEYKLGDKLLFTVEATAGKYTVNGFSKNEGTHTWTEGHEATLSLRITDKIDSDLLMHMGYVNTNGIQDVIIKVNDVKLSEFKASGSGRNTILIPKKIVGNGDVTIKMEFPNAKTPSKTIKRILALAMKDLWIDKMSYTPYTFGEEIFFDKQLATASPYLISGFRSCESYGTWTEGYLPMMQFELHGNYEDVLLEMQYESFGKQRVELYANNQFVGAYVANGNEKQSLRIPHEYVSDGRLVLSISLPDAVSPKSLGKNADARILALCMKSMKLSSVSPHNQ